MGDGWCVPRRERLAMVNFAGHVQTGGEDGAWLLKSQLDPKVALQPV